MLEDYQCQNMGCMNEISGEEYMVDLKHIEGTQEIRISKRLCKECYQVVKDMVVGMGLAVQLTVDKSPELERPRVTINVLKGL